MDNIVLEVGFDDHTSYFNTTTDAIKEAAKLPVKERWDSLFEKCEPAQIHSSIEVNYFLDLTAEDEDEVWQTLLEEIEQEEE